IHATADESKARKTQSKNSPMVRLGAGYTGPTRSNVFSPCSSSEEPTRKGGHASAMPACLRPRAIGQLYSERDRRSVAIRSDEARRTVVHSFTIVYLLQRTSDGAHSERRRRGNDPRRHKKRLETRRAARNTGLAIRH